MSYQPGHPEIRSVFMDFILNMPDSPGRRRAIIRLLWNEAAGPIISQHVTIKRCRENGRIAVEINDRAWMKEVRKASKLIIDRINTSLTKLGLLDYTIHGVDMYPAPPSPPSPRKSEPAPKKPEIPDNIREKIEALPEDLRKGALDWYISWQLKKGDRR